MELFKTILVCFFAGAGAGIGTGFAGMSAAAVIAPLLSTFLGIPAYDAIGIGLASDVLASGVSAMTYRKNGNLNIRSSLVLMVTILIMTVIGSFTASFLPERTMSSTIEIAMIIMGLRFLLKPIMTTQAQMADIPKSRQHLESLIGGIIVGFICGFVGAGGGMMMLFVLTSFLGYELHTAVGTSVFIMMFTALTGSVSHFMISDMPDVPALVFCVVFTLLWAQIASKLANRAKTITLNRVVGCVLIITSIVVLVVNRLR